jgi:ribosomal protein S18 acetylase RimI-like enzyme
MKNEFLIQLKNISTSDFIQSRFNYILLLNEKKIGRFSIADTIYNNNVTIENVMIYKRYRNKGLGTKVIKNIVEKFIPKNRPLVKRISLAVKSNNKAAIKVYRRCGFRKSKDTVSIGSIVMDKFL